MNTFVRFFVRFLNFCLSIFGAYRDTNGRIVSHRAWCHWSNENEDRRTGRQGFPYEGRFWLHVGHRLVFRFSWDLWSTFCHAEINADPDERDITVGLALPPVAFWFGVSGLNWKFFKSTAFKSSTGGKYGTTHSIGLSVHDWAIWWDVWADQEGWSSKTPRWRDGCWHVLDTFLGKSRYSEEVLSEHDVVIPMPEGGYPAKVQMRLDTWKRSRWFAQHFYRADIDCPKGIPHAGKGENSWDCGEDRTYGLSTTAETVEEAIAKMTQTVLRARRRYDGSVMAQYPSPQAATVAA